MNLSFGKSKEPRKVISRNTWDIPDLLARLGSQQLNIPWINGNCCLLSGKAQRHVYEVLKNLFGDFAFFLIQAAIFPTCRSEGEYTF